MKWIKLENVDKLVNLDFIEYITKEGEEEEDYDDDDTSFQIVLYPQEDEESHSISYAKKSWRDRDFLEICRLLEEKDGTLAYLTGNKMNVGTQP